MTTNKRLKVGNSRKRRTHSLVVVMSVGRIPENAILTFFDATKIRKGSLVVVNYKIEASRDSGMWRSCSFRA